MRMRVLLGLSLIASTAYAEPAPREFRPTLIKQPITKTPRKQLTGVQAAPTSRTLFIHRCPEVVGCPLTRGVEDNSRQNISSISSFASATIGPFTRGDEVWNKVMTCVRDTYAPYNITITDEDPGGDVDHYEVMVGGKNTDLRNDSPDAGGIAPFTCNEIPNAISFVFDVWGNNADVICSVVAQESAHAFGLEHEMLADDPMTYLSGPDVKRFRADPAPCGEYQARPCDCGGTMQTSYDMLVGLFGPGAPRPPTVSIKSPSSNKTVQPGFITRIDAVDDVKVVKVELLIDGEVVGMLDAPPFKIAAPDLPEGPHTIEARATDIQGTPATSAAVLVDLGPPCTASTGCSDGDVCVMGLCVVGPGEPGGLGNSCQAASECVSENCVESTDGGFCTEVCDLSPGSCPSGFDCVPGGTAGVCFPVPDAGCCDSRSNPTSAALFALGFGVLILRRRRR